LYPPKITTGFGGFFWEKTMSIKRAKHTINYTVVANNLINNNVLNWDELGLLVYLLSKPENWETKPLQLAKIRKAGINKIYSMLKKLQSLGYAVYTRDSGGTVDWTIYDEPQINLKPHDEKPHDEKPHEAFCDVLISKENTISKDLKKDHAEFESLWVLYEKKGNKKTSFDRFKKLSRKKRDKMFAHIPLYKQSRREKKYRKDLERYISKECWEDEIISDEPQKMEYI
jgi:hypothetical protein